MKANARIGMKANMKRLCDPNPTTEYTSRVSFDMDVQQPVSHVQSGGVKWLLTREMQNAQRSHLRGEAAGNARQDAQEYAAALGYKDVWAFEFRERAAYTCSSKCKGGPRLERREDVGTVTRNMAEEGWEDASEEASQSSPKGINLTQSVQMNARFW